MRTKNFLKHLILGALLLTTGKVVGQVTTPSNVASGPTDFLGWDNTVTNNFPLRVRHDRNERIEWYTDAVRRMFLHQTLTGQTVNGYTTVDLSGNLGIGLFNATTGSGPIVRPLTLLHLDNGGTEDAGFRDWMRTGATMTHLSDLMYVGLKIDTADVNTAAIVWSDNNQGGLSGPDRLRFIFTRDNQGGTIAASDDGLEIARMIPAASANEGFFGVGDWFTDGTNPDERLDVLDRTIRIRRLIPDYQNDTLDQIVVADSTGRLHWRDISTISGADCDWVIQSPDPHVSSSYSGSSCTWGDTHGVGIGLPIPKFKLQVFHHDNTLLEETAIWGSSRFALSNYEWMPAIHGEARSPGSDDVNTMQSIGVQGDATGAVYSYGVFGQAAQSSSANGQAFGLLGVFGMANSFDNSDWNVGVYGKAAGASNGNDWGGWFEGRGFLGASAWNYSDESLKTDIQSLAPSTSLDAIMDLQPRSYSYDTVQFHGLGLPATQQLGLVAQEVEPVLPQLVMDVTRPALMDSTGQVAQEALQFKAMNYIGLIPVLVSAMQAQNARIDELEMQLASCCATNDDGARGAPVTGSALGSSSTLNPEEQLTPAQERLLRIAPNPFTDRTTLYCTLERAGRMQLIANSADGRDLKVLQEGQREAGEFQYEWSTENLAPGGYYITLLLDGEPVVKRAVKVGR